MSRRVEYTQLGGPEVLTIVEVEPPHPGPGEVRVHVRAAGLNPLDAKLFSGRPTSSGKPTQLPSGNGHDFAGVVDELGEGVTEVALGAEVFAQIGSRAQADFVIAKASTLTVKPAAMPFDVAGALTVSVRTASASVDSLQLTAADTVFVSAAAGGVGVLAVQLAKRTGATVVGSASADNHEFLESLGVIPVEYGPGLADALRKHHITAALDNHGRDSVDAALAAGAPASRVNSIADYAAAADYGTTAVGSAGYNQARVVEVAELIASGELQFPIDSIYPLERVVDAYRRLLGGHLRGKIVLALE